MCEDEEEMYALALGEEYMPGASDASLTNSEVKIPDKNPTTSTEQNSKVSTEQTILFRKLIIGSRSQITRLKGENEQLKTNLKNAVDSSGTVTCPNCTHHFKERLCPLRPRAMKKIKARNCVELEFNTPEELEAWLHLNQLETNNDGLPTVMDVKKPSREIPSLKTVGSLLPEYYEKKKKDDEKKKRKDESSGKDNRTSSLNRAIEKKRTFDKPQVDQKTSISKNDHSKRHESKESDERSRRRSKETDRSGSSRTNRSRETTDRVDRERRGKDIERKDTERTTRSNRTTHNESYKRKHSPSEDDTRDSKSQKRSITGRVQFPGRSNDSPPKSFDSMMKEISNSVKGTRKTGDSMNGFSETSKEKRQPIVWNSSKTETKIQHTEITFIPFEFKVKSMEKKEEKKTSILDRPDSAAICSKPSPVVIKTYTSKTASTAPEIASSEKVSPPSDMAKPTSSKYKFVPTSKKNIETSTQKEEVDGIAESSTKDPISAVDEAAVTSEIIVWNLIPIRKTEDFLQRLQEARFFWSEKIKICNKMLGKSTPLNQSSTDLMSMPSTEAKTRININSVNFKECGISAEGLAILKHLKSRKTADEESIGQKVRNLENKLADTDIETHKTASSSLKPVGSTNEVVSGMAFTPQLQGSSAPESYHNIVESKKVEEEDNEFREFFPDLVIARQGPATATKTETVRRMYSTGSFGSMMDREEDELQLLIREDSAVPPNGDYVLDAGLDQFASASTQNPEKAEQRVVLDERAPSPTQNDQNDNWDEFCLEDLDEEVDDTMRERKISEMEKLGASIEEEMEWTASQGDEQTNGEEEYDTNLEDQHEDSQLSGDGAIEAESPSTSTRRPISTRLEMDNDFRLSDDENAESPRTSTPSRSVIPDDLDNPPEESNVSEQPVQLKDDSFIDELDWNYGTDYEDEDGENEEVMNTEKPASPGEGVGGTDDTENGGNADQLEDGEISEEEDIEVIIKEEPKKPMRERIKFVVDERQARGPSPERDRHRRHRTERERSRRSPDRRRRSSGENNRQNKERDKRPATYRSLLKRRN